MEFHITRRARERYSFDQSLYSYNGNVIFANFHSVRLFTQKINDQKDLVTFPEQAIKAGQINAMGLIDEIFHHVFSLYRTEKNPQVLKNMLQTIKSTMGAQKLDSLLGVFVSQYPPLAVYRKEILAAAYLKGDTLGNPNRELLLEELILLWVSTRNPALDPFDELIIDPLLLNDFRFEQIITIIDKYFSTQPGFGPKNQSLIEMLRTPAIQVPHSITGQLEYIRENWSFLLGDYLYRLLSSLDLIKEENKLSFIGPGPIAIPLYNKAEFLAVGGKDFEIEAFSPDRDWMPKLVLLAKNSFVWLDQLSQKYDRAITTLDQIPDEEFEILNRQGITGLWLIGLWQRSPASARIKQLCGNPEAISSAYSLFSYQIATELGGDSAYESLREKATRHGIRLASDMVPNHMGIDSEWVIHQPERFLALDRCPFPSYQFNGPDLSTNPAVVIQIEDHYYDRSDAAVVFRRIDKNTGQTKFIYHGNDGTAMPWNDTAQLNYLDAQVREAVIQTILEVARKFPIIRFDAAMTLAKKHIQRLWFPQQGSGGAIPSRSEFALSQEDFDRAIPVEFWREVVDRVAKDAPDTLLLAEAFWLMESYFVRTLGMHRVYNSAFMHMLRNEDNAGYRKIIKNTLEFEPEILRRFVNFMNNPDERTAVEQFGKGDKYFGICTLMATLPGLPMFGHGQIEGFSEKYGMEFRRAHQQEKVDDTLLSRHEIEIFPLLHQRELFAGVENFSFFDYSQSNGHIDENVFAFTNRFNDKSALVLYNNTIGETEGWIKTSVAQPNKSTTTKRIAKKEFHNAIGFDTHAKGYLVFRDQMTGLKYLRPMQEIINRGFFIRLKGYEHHVFLDFNVQPSDPSHDYDHLYALIGENGVPDIDRALSELRLQPVLQPFREIINSGYLEFIYENVMHPEKCEGQKTLSEFKMKLTPFIVGTAETAGAAANPVTIVDEITCLMSSLLNLPKLTGDLTIPGTKQLEKAITQLLKGNLITKLHWFTITTWVVLCRLGKLTGGDDAENLTLSWVDEWGLASSFEETLRSSGFAESESHQAGLALRLAVGFQNWYEESKNLPIPVLLKHWFSNPDFRSYVNVNRYNDILWYNRESLNELLWWMGLIPVLQSQASGSSNRVTTSETILGVYEKIKKIKALDKKSDYRVEKLIQNIPH